MLILEISSEELILNSQQLMRRLGQLAADVNRYMHQTWASLAIYEYQGFTADPNPNNDPDHLGIWINSDGTININGSSPFWSCFLIEIPSVQYQFCFYGPRDNIATDYTRRRRSLSVDPLTGEPSFAKVQTDAVGNAISLLRHQKRYMNETRSMYNGANADNDILFKCKANTLSSLERRIALEIGCSLPIKNSPMVDHERETPDFTIARWIYKTNPRFITNDRGGSRQYETDTPVV